MSQEALEAIVSSKARLQIADLVSTRPRTLRELADFTGISIQGVLKHLDKLNGLGLIAEKRVSGGSLPVRKLYAIKGVRVGDFSYGGLTIVKMSRSIGKAVGSENPVPELESLAADAIVQRRRIRDQARRLGRMIDDFVDTETRIEGLVRSLDVKDDERLLIQTAFTEESLEEAERTLREHQGLKDARRALEKALSRARKVGKK
ncbi:MAG: winged helix-turn-helix domain-containing protein [Nitrososphaerales archaeon]|nr:winged helix-turn-helix domain-containing protein [Nitrososphaerales archaeon]